MFSPDVLDLFRRLLMNVTVSAAADDFEEVAALVVKAKRELSATTPAEASEEG